MESDTVVSLKKLKDEVEDIKRKLAAFEAGSAGADMSNLAEVLSTMVTELYELNKNFHAFARDLLAGVVPKLERIEANTRGFANLGKTGEIKFERPEWLDEFKVAIAQLQEAAKQMKGEVKVKLDEDFKKELAGATTYDFSKLEQVLMQLVKELREMKEYNKKMLEYIERAAEEALEEDEEEEEPEIKKKEDEDVGLEIKEEEKEEKKDDTGEIAGTLKQISSQNRELLETLNKLIDGMNKLGEE